MTPGQLDLLDTLTAEPEPAHAPAGTAAPCRARLATWTTETDQ